MKFLWSDPLFSFLSFFNENSFGSDKKQNKTKKTYKACCVVENGQEFAAYEDASTANEATTGFWGVLARKAKAMLDDDVVAQHHQHGMSSKTTSQSHNTSTQSQVNNFIFLWIN